VKGVFYLKVRDAPGFEAKQTGVLAAGDVVDVLGEVGLWANIALENGATGYVSSKYLAPVTGPTRNHEPPIESARKTDEAEATDKTEARDTIEAREREEAGEAVAPTDRIIEARDTIEAAEKVDRIPPPDNAGPSQDSAPPPGKPEVAPTTIGEPPEPGLAPCTSTDLDKHTRELQELAAAQRHLADLITAGASEEPAGRDWSQSISTRQMLFWFGAGCFIGWLVAVGLMHRRERRQRIRIRI